MTRRIHTGSSTPPVNGVRPLLRRSRGSARTPAVVAGLAQIDGDDEGALAPGQVPVSWMTTRAMGTARLERVFADIGAAESLAYLHVAMADRLVHWGIKQLDGGVIRGAQREFTQEISLHVFARSKSDGSPAFTGIAYQSRLGTST